VTTLYQPTVEARLLHNYLPGHNKVYIAYVENTTDGMFAVFGAYGGAAQSSLTVQRKGVYDSLDLAKIEVNRLAREKERKGYVDLRNLPHSPYKGGLTPEAIFAKIDGSRVVGVAAPVVWDWPASPPRPQPKPVDSRPAPSDIPNGARRGRRTLNL
jgi:predicted DNA-binding WGR domain protein